MDKDKIEIEILPDGTIKLSTDKVSDANHTNAENLLKAISELAGGSTDIKLKNMHGHHHHKGGVHHTH